MAISPDSGVPWYSTRGQHDFEYLLDGDEHRLTPGEDFTGSVAVFRTKIYKLCQRRGLRYRSRLWDGALYIQVFRTTPGDRFDEVYDEAGNPKPAVAGPPAP